MFSQSWRAVDVGLAFSFIRHIWPVCFELIKTLIEIDQFNLSLVEQEVDQFQIRPIHLWRLPLMSKNENFCWRTAASLERTKFFLNVAVT